MAGYLASNFHTEKANHMAIVQSRLIFFFQEYYILDAQTSQEQGVLRILSTVAC